MAENKTLTAAEVERAIEELLRAAKAMRSLTTEQDSFPADAGPGPGDQ